LDVFAWLLNPTYPGHIPGASENLANKLLQNHIWDITFVLGADDQRIVVPAMHLLHSFTLHSITIARVFLTKFNWDLPALRMIPSKIFTWRFQGSNQTSSYQKQSAQAQAQSQEIRERDLVSVEAMKTNRTLYLQCITSLLTGVIQS